MCGVFALVLAVSSSCSLSGDEAFSVFGQLKSDQSHVRRMDGDSDGRPVLLVLRDLLDIDAVSQSVYLIDFALGSLPISVHNHDFVISPHGQRSDAVLLSEFGAKSSAEESVLDVRRGRKVCLSGLSSAAGNFYLSRLYLDVSSFHSENFINNKKSNYHESDRPMSTPVSDI